MHLGQQIMYARQKRGIGPYTLARELKISANTLKKLESEGWTRDQSVIQRIADHLDATFVVQFMPQISAGQID